MHLNESLTRVHSQKEPRLHVGESFTLKESEEMFLDPSSFLKTKNMFYVILLTNQRNLQTDGHGLNTLGV